MERLFIVRLKVFCSHEFEEEELQEEIDEWLASSLEQQPIDGVRTITATQVSELDDDD